MFVQNRFRLGKIDIVLLSASLLLTLLSTFVLRSISPSIYPNYFFYLVAALIIFFFLVKIDFDMFSLFSYHLYIFSILFLVLPLVFGQITRGAVRWIPIGSFSIQPSEIVRPFLLLFLARFVTEKEFTLKRLVQSLVLFGVPFFLILIQPSLGVAALTAVGFVGVLFASTIKKKYFLIWSLIALSLIPLIWLILAPYQRQRVYSFLKPEEDPFGAGYNSIQSMIAVGSGRLGGRGLGEGVQTQLAFLPEKHTDFIFAAIAEEMGFLGAGLTLFGLFVIFWCLVKTLESAKHPEARAFISGVLLILFAETCVHVGMNMGLLPITGVPLPLVSAGGSSLLGTVMMLAIAIRARKG